VTSDLTAGTDLESNRQTGPTVEASQVAHKLPDKPLVVLKPSGSVAWLDLRDLWQYRDLLYILTERDIKVRYKQTLLGAAWAIIQPLFTMIIFSLFFGRLAAIPSDGVPYPIFAFAGLLPWVFFSNAITNGGNSLIGNTNLITKVYFPRMIIPIASVAAGLVDLFVSFLLLAALMFYYGVSLTMNIVMLPVLVLISSLLAIGVGMWMSGLNVKFRDIRYALPFVVQLGIFVTPIIYPASMVPEKYRLLFALNPMTGIIEGYRSAIFGKPFDWSSLRISILLTVVIVLFSLYSFRRMERKFADLI